MERVTLNVAVSFHRLKSTVLPAATFLPLWHPCTPWLQAKTHPSYSWVAFVVYSVMETEVIQWSTLRFCGDGACVGGTKWFLTSPGPCYTHEHAHNLLTHRLIRHGTRHKEPTQDALAEWVGTHTQLPHVQLCTRVKYLPFIYLG